MTTHDDPAGAGRPHGRTTRRGRPAIAVGLAGVAALLIAAPAADAAWQQERTWKTPGVTETDVAPSGEVITRKRGEVKHYAADGKQLHAWSFPWAPTVTVGVALDGDEVVIVSDDIDLDDSSFVSTLRTYALDGKPLSETRPFVRDVEGLGGDPKAGSLDIDATGDRYYSMSNPGLPSIQRFGRAGQAISTFGSTGAGPGQFGRSLPQVASDGKGHVYVTDPAGGRVEAFTSAGAFVRSWGQSGSTPGNFQTPNEIATDPQGDVWVAEALGKRRIQHFRPDGRLVEVVEVPKITGSTGGNLPVVGLGFDKAGRLYIATSNAIASGSLSDGNLQVLSQGPEVASKSLRYRRSRIAIEVRCPGASACSGTVKVKKGATVLGSRAYKVKAGKSATVSVKPGSRGRRSLSRSRKHQVAVVLAPKGGAATSKKLTLRR